MHSQHDGPHLKKVWRMLPMWEEASSMERYTYLLSLDPLGFSCLFWGRLECLPFLPRREMGRKMGPCKCSRCQLGLCCTFSLPISYCRQLIPEPVI